MSSPIPEEDFSQIQPELEFDEEFTEEDVHEFCLMICDLPSMALGEHLHRTDEQVKRFSHQLYLYCKKKGIDVQDYMFDEFGLVFSGFVLLNGYRQDHKKYKDNKKDSIEPSTEEAIDDGIHQSFSEPHTPIEVHEHRDSSSGGDNPPAKTDEPSKADEPDDVDDPTADDTYIIHGGIPV